MGFRPILYLLWRDVCQVSFKLKKILNLNWILNLKIFNISIFKLGRLKFFVVVVVTVELCKYFSPILGVVSLLLWIVPSDEEKIFIWI